MRFPFALAATALVLVGCTAAPTPEPTPAETPTPTVAAIAPGTVVASGSFSGQATGTVELVALEQGMFEVRLTDFVSEVATPSSLLLSPYPLTPDRTCLDTFAFDLADAAENDCLRTVVAIAPFAWDFPDYRPGLDVVDSGPTVGAMGSVTLENGEPMTYTVAPDDIMSEIAARLGITVDDILYLNPGRLASGPQAQADEVLNLSRANR